MTLLHTLFLLFCQIIEIPDDNENPPSPDKKATGKDTDGDASSSERDGGSRDAAGEKEREKDGEKELKSSYSPKESTSAEAKEEHFEDSKPKGKR